MKGDTKWGDLRYRYYIEVFGVRKLEFQGYRTAFIAWSYF